MKYLISKTPIAKSTLAKLPLEFELRKLNDFYLVYEKDCLIIENNDLIAIVDGYVLDSRIPDQSKKDHILSFLSHLSENWPMPENFSGSFSILLFNFKKNTIIVSNDPIGPYPLYYLKDNTKNFTFSNNILCLGWFLNLSKDETGIYQRLVGPELSNIGSRTILENVKRLLPGEKITLEDNALKHYFDNSLYSNIREKDLNSIPKESIQLKELLNLELSSLIRGKPKANIALSGGLDSRVLLASLGRKIELECLTYGANQYYETKIARKLAKKSNAAFQNFDDSEYIFPDSKILEKYVLETESVFITNWLAILEQKSIQHRELLFIGDMCESIPGRNIGKFNSKKFRKKNFFKTHIQNKDFEFTNLTKENFERWKKEVRKKFLYFYQEVSLRNSDFSISLVDLHSGLFSDLEEIFSRIESHNLPYIELCEELFKWFTHSRSGMHYQINICNKKFKSICPNMGMRIIRFTSNIHPNLRLGNRIMDGLFQRNQFSKKLFSTPTSQAPYISQNAPPYLKFLSWGMRSTIDSYLVNRIIRTKNKKLRYRTLPSYNWVEAYDKDENLKRFQHYFVSNNIGDRWYGKLEKTFYSRKKLQSWPFTNTNFISAASVNKELELIQKFK